MSDDRVGDEVGDEGVGVRAGRGKDGQVEDWLVFEGAPRYWVQAVIGIIFLAAVGDIIYHLAR